MGRKWSDIRATLDAETLDGAAALLTSLRLRGLREARGLTQTEMADRLEVRQVSVSRMESRSDVHVSTLRAVIEAMGGELQIRAVFPDAEYTIEVGEEADIRSSPTPGAVSSARDAA